MKYNLTDQIQQSYTSETESTKVDILYNNYFNYFYFNLFVDGALVQGDTRIVNNYSNDYVSFSSTLSDYASFEEVTNFTIEVLDYE
ncbi:MAG: hypothetical protein ACPGDB_04170 [Fusobacterium sp.]